VVYILSNKSKIFNDPVYGFITIPDELIFDLIESHYFQRLRNIKQLGLTHLVFPGALHTRFQHAMGAMHLMMMAVETLTSKGHEITKEEENALYIAILLHDIGHGPFSHALENSIVDNLTHEDLSEIFMDHINKKFSNKINTAISIFKNKYPKKFLHQLVSSQLDMDRLDYLMRDSYFTGVTEGVIGYDRIIKMMNVVNDQLVIEAKGIYSIEKFIISRRLMYWQVYLHKTVIAAENLLVKILQRAKEIAQMGEKISAPPALEFFLFNDFTKKDFIDHPEFIDAFAILDDHDVMTAIKMWMNHKDFILNTLSKSLIQRKLFRTEIQNKAFTNEYIKKLSQAVMKIYPVSHKLCHYFLFQGTISNSAYDYSKLNITILFKNGKLSDISTASDQLYNTMLSKSVVKHFICYPKNLNI